MFTRHSWFESSLRKLSSSSSSSKNRHKNCNGNSHAGSSPKPVEDDPQVPAPNLTRRDSTRKSAKKPSSLTSGDSQSTSDSLDSVGVKKTPPGVCWERLHAAGTKASEAKTSKAAKPSLGGQEDELILVAGENGAKGRALGNFVRKASLKGAVAGSLLAKGINSRGSVKKKRYKEGRNVLKLKDALEQALRKKVCHLEFDERNCFKDLQDFERKEEVMVALNQAENLFPVFF